MRSYVLRQGRTTPAQKRALEELLPKYGVAFSSSIPDWKSIFGRKADLVLEIGSGMGETTAQIARAHPATDFIAVEVHAPGVGSLLNRIAKENLSNIRVVRHDALEVLDRMIPDAALSAIHVFFPDPWPKKRHHKRRLVRPEFAALAARKLAPGGSIHLATDWPEYADQMAQVFLGSVFFAEAKSGFAARPATKFETRGRRLGHPIRDLSYLRRENARAAR